MISRGVSKTQNPMRGLRKMFAGLAEGGTARQRPGEGEPGRTDPLRGHARVDGPPLLAVADGSVVRESGLEEAARGRSGTPEGWRLVDAGKDHRRRATLARICPWPCAYGPAAHGICVSGTASLMPRTWLTSTIFSRRVLRSQRGRNVRASE